MGILITIFALGVVIFIHELGHLLVAKLSGVGVYEFSIGMGPKIFSIKSKETNYSLRFLPFGGFVKLYGMDDEESQEIDPQKDFHKKPLLKRLATIAAGSVMNILLGLGLFILLAMAIGVFEPSNVIEKVLPGTPAAKVGLLPGDAIFLADYPQTTNIIPIINQSEGKTLKLKVLRDNNEFALNVIPETNDKSNQAMIGIQLKVNNKKLSFLGSIKYGFKSTLFQVKQTLITLGMLVRGKLSLKNMAGPIGIVQVASNLFYQGFVSFINIFAIISVSLGVINLFPFPVLDGGYLVLLLVEAIRGKRLSEKIETIINNTGMAVLVSLMIIIVTNDILHWKQRMIYLKSLSGM
jgi:regulator of sigma E protease